jgi:hypothetical protein
MFHHEMREDQITSPSLAVENPHVPLDKKKYGLKSAFSQQKIPLSASRAFNVQKTPKPGPCGSAMMKPCASAASAASPHVGHGLNIKYSPLKIMATQSQIPAKRRLGY